MIKFFFLCVLAFLSFMVSFPVYAQTPDKPTFDQSIFPNAAPGGGELFDFRTGNLGFEIPISVLKGPPGLDINVSLSFNKTSSIPGGNSILVWQANKNAAGASLTSGIGAAQWWFEVPRLESSFFQGIVCGRRTGLSPTLILPGSAPVKFLNASSTTSPVKGVDYFSADRSWTGKCVSSSVAIPVIDKEGNYDFVVQSKDGIIYRFSRLPMVPGYRSNLYIPNLPHYGEQLYAGYIAGQVFYASRVEDRFGNWIEYQYTGRNLTRIYSNDGREIKLTYEEAPIQTSYQISTTTNITLSPTPVTRLKTISILGHIWELNYQNCTGQFSLDCMANSFVPNWITDDKPSVMILNHILKSVRRPDGKEYAFEYSVYDKPKGLEDRSLYPTPGVKIHVSKLTDPKGLVSEYSYQSLLNTYINGKKPTTVDSLNLSYLALVKKSYSGVGITNKIVSEYSYFVNNFNNTTNESPETVSYSFMSDSEKLIVSKFSRDPKGGDLASPETAGLKAGLLLENAVMPLPEVDYGGLPAINSITPLIPAPSISVLNSQLVYPEGQAVSIDFLTYSGLPVIAAQCRIDNGLVIPCNSLNSFSTSAPLPAGKHTISITVVGASGMSTEKSIEFWVGNSQEESAPKIVRNINHSYAKPGQSFTFSPQFSGRLTYLQWYKNNRPLAGANSQNLTFAKVTASDFGEYYLVAYNGKATAVTYRVRLRLDPSVVASILSMLE